MWSVECCFWCEERINWPSWSSSENFYAIICNEYRVYPPLLTHIFDQIVSWSCFLFVQNADMKLWRWSSRVIFYTLLFRNNGVFFLMVFAAVDRFHCVHARRQPKCRGILFHYIYCCIPKYDRISRRQSSRRLGMGKMLFASTWLSCADWWLHDHLCSKMCPQPLDTSQIEKSNQSQ